MQPYITVLIFITVCPVSKCILSDERKFLMIQSYEVSV